MSVAIGKVNTNDNDKVTFQDDSGYRTRQLSASKGDHDVPHERYIPVNRLAYDSQDQVALAWSLGFYPATKTSKSEDRFGRTTTTTRNDLYSSENFTGRQNADGSGELMHYSTREAIRTQSGLIIDNVQCWSAGFARCSTPPSSMIDYRLPLSAIENMASDQGKRVELTELTEDQIIDYESSREFLIDFGDFAIMVAEDSSAINHGSRFACFITKDQLGSITRVQGVKERILKPDEVKQAERDGFMIMDSNGFTKTRFRNPGDEVVELEDLTFHTESYNGSEIYHNRKAYLPSLQGECIVRQGEYFFIPTELPDNAGDFCTEDIKLDDDDRGIELDGSFYEIPRRRSLPSILGSHNASEMKITLDGKLYVRGQVKHDTNDHNMIHLGETWHRVVTHGIPSLSVETGPRNRGTRAD
jgi:hypothetical protein